MNISVRAHSLKYVVAMLMVVIGGTCAIVGAIMSMILIKND